jgi:hypothetical protein
MAAGDGVGAATLKPFRHWGWAWPAAIVAITVLRFVAFTSTPAPDPSPTPMDAPPTTPAPAVVAVQPPRIVRGPTRAEFAHVYPAIARGVAATVRLRCAVITPDGLVNDCLMVDETPARQGFGEAAQGTLRYIRMKPATASGDPSANGPFVLHIHFAPPSANSAATGSVEVTPIEPVSGSVTEPQPPSQPQSEPQPQPQPERPKRRVLGLLWLLLPFAAAVIGAMAWADLWPPETQMRKRRPGQYA